MKKISKLLILIAALSIIFSPQPKSLDAYGYRPDMNGYAYQDSCFCFSAAPLIPLAAVAVAVIVGIALSNGSSNGSH